MFKKFLQVERPAQITQYQPGTLRGKIIYFIKYFIFGFIFLGIEYLIGESIPRPYINPPPQPPGFDYAGNAAMFFLAAFLLIVPQLIGMTVNVKTKRPSYAYCVIFGFMTSGIVFYFVISRAWGLYMIFTTGCLILVHLIPHQHYSIKFLHVLYYFCIGILICYINYQIIAYFMDVWNYLQALMLSVVLAITIGLRIRQWSYIFLAGWLVCAVALMGYAIYMINVLQISDNGMFLLGFFLFSGPLISAIGVLGIFFIAWRGIGNKSHLRNTTYTPLEEKSKKQ